MKNERFYNIIDIHTHILNNVDDGSQSIEETKNLFKEAEKVGVKEIILTPHYYKGLYTEKNDIILDKYNNLLKLLDEDKISLKVHIGREIYIIPDISDEIISGELLSLANTKYLLLETSFEIRQLFLESELKKIIENGYKPILAHVERYNFVQKDVTVLDKLINMGIKIQSNYGSILGMYGKKAQKTVKKLLKMEKIDYMSSDVHREQTVYQHIPKAIEKMGKLVSNEYLEKITYTNAKNIINESLQKLDKNFC